MQVHRQHTLNSGGGEEIGDQLCGDRHPRLILAVLPGVAEERNYRRDSRGARPSGGIHHDEQLHQVLIRRRTGRLNDEDIAAANVLVDLDERLAVRKRTDRRVAGGHTKIGADVRGESRMG